MTSKTITAIYSTSCAQKEASEVIRSVLSNGPAPLHDAINIFKAFLNIH